MLGVVCVAHCIQRTRYDVVGLNLLLLLLGEGVQGWEDPECGEGLVDGGVSV